MTLTLWNENILLVDDEKGILTMITTILKKEGFHRITTATTGREALRLIREETYNLIVLDVMLPDCNGFDLCQQIRSHTSVPILFLTARSGDLDKILGLGIGGDDYITKPFNPLEVVARIQSQLRRQQLYSADAQHKANVMDFGSFVVDKGAAQLIVNGDVTHCPAKEFELLSFLCSHPNQVFTALQLYEQVWGVSLMGDEKTVVIHISRLRKKIEMDSSNPKIIVNVRGIGYKFIPPRAGMSHEG